MFAIYVRWLLGFTDDIDGIVVNPPDPVSHSGPDQQTAEQRHPQSPLEHDLKSFYLSVSTISKSL